MSTIEFMPLFYRRVIIVGKEDGCMLPIACLGLYSSGCIGCTCYGLVNKQCTTVPSQLHINIAILS